MTWLDQKATMDFVAWCSNVSTSVLIVFVNKVLMSTTGYGYAFATTLSALHFLACAASIRSVQAAGFATKAQLPFKESLKFAAVAGTSIASLNLSLLVNTVGIYQMAKLLIIPFVCVVEGFWFGRKLSAGAKASIATVTVGVGIVTISDVSVNSAGLIIAGISVATSGLQQIMCGQLQRKWKLSSYELLANTAPIQGVVLMFVGPFIDRMTTDMWVYSYSFSKDAFLCLLFSCTVAIGVNLSQFMCLGRFTAVSFQVLGHTKTILVLLGGWLFLNESITQRQLFGMALAVSGMVAYGVAKSKMTASEKVAAKSNLPVYDTNSNSEKVAYKQLNSSIPTERIFVNVKV